ncbi:MAG: hypothetical protein M1826_004775 [Phylliscum demangeonii]|nr:MAG: hypothetical protein M1826_004775 [Phylliscum demangeonii]
MFGEECCDPAVRTDRAKQLLRRYVAEVDSVEQSYQRRLSEWTDARKAWELRLVYRLGDEEINIPDEWLETPRWRPVPYCATRLPPLPLRCEDCARSDTDLKRRRHSPINPFEHDSDGDARDGDGEPDDEPGLAIKPERTWSLERDDGLGHPGAAIKTEATDGDDTESEWNGIDDDDDELRANRADDGTTTDPRVARDPAVHLSS